jgi:signal transduction histidine kinase
MNNIRGRLMRSKKSTIILLISFFVGLSVLLYPSVSSYWNSKRQSKTVVNYEAMLAAIAINADDITVVVTDNQGNIVLSTGVSAEYIPDAAMMPKSFMDEINNGKNISGFKQIDGVFDEPQLVNAAPIINNSYVFGTVFSFSASASVNELLDVMIQTLVLSSLWVMLAALIAVYIISRKVIGPLKEISGAAKKFASGSFDVRVEVKGKDEVAQLAMAFNNMAQSLDNYEDTRNAFVANVSHDLRTPMTTISGFIDGILAGAIPPEKHEHYLGVIAGEVKRLSRLVTTLLDVTRLQGGERKFVMTEFDVCEMARQILISFEQKIESKQLDIEFECSDDSIYVSADRDAIYQVLYNICDNAMKFSFEKGKLAMSVTYNKEKKVEVSVYNEGTGIPKEDLPYIFERFFKSDKSRGLDKTGVGLGMFITKTIMEAHSESITVDSEYGKWCRFSFTLKQAEHAPKYKIQERRTI